MSREQANTYKKYREADDAMGNLGWAAKMAKNAVRRAPEAPADIEREFGFGEKEKLLWELLKIPRKYSDMETCGVMPAEVARGFFRGLVAADVLDMLQANEGKALLPLEIKRAKAKVAGKSAEPQAVQRKAIHERVFRPDIGLSGEGAPVAPASAAAPARPAPAPVAAAAPDKEAPLNAKDWEVKKRILKAFESMREQNHYGFLGIKQGAGDDEIKAAGLRLARDYHPDILSGTVLANDARLGQKLDALFKRLQEARQVLGNADRRRDYDNNLEAGTNRSAGQKVRRPAEAKVAFSKAEAFFKKKDYDNAELHYRTAAELDFDDPKLQVALAWCTFLNESHDKAKRTDKAYRKLTGVLDKYKNADAAYRLGIMARMDGDESKALKRFKEAVRLDDKHQAAAQEVRVAERRANKAKDDKKDGGIFGKFLKR